MVGNGERLPEPERIPLAPKHPCGFPEMAAHIDRSNVAKTRQRPAPVVTRPEFPLKGVLAVALLGTLLYLPTANYEFTFDDHVIVERNPNVQEVSRWRETLTSDYWPGGQSGLYRPVTMLFFAAERLVHGGDPAGYHVVSAILHGSVSGMVSLIAADLGAAFWPALAAGALFAAHPLHTEVVCGIVGRAELVASLLALLAFRAWFGLRARTGRSKVLVPAFLFLLAIFAKESVIVLPALILLRELKAGVKGARFPRIPALSAWPWALVGAAFCGVLVRALALGGLSASFAADPPFVENPLAREGVVPRMIAAAANQTHGLALHFWPAPLVADYSHATLPVVRNLFHPGVLLFSGFLAVVCVLWFERRWAPAGLIAGLSWYGLAILPTANLLIPIGTVFAERLYYFPSAGLCLAAGFLLNVPLGSRGEWMLPKGRREWASLAAAGIAVAAFASIALVRMPVWQNDEALFRDTVEKAPRNVKARLWMGDTLARTGRFAEALREYDSALAIYPEYFAAAANRVVPLVQMDRYDEAIAAGQRALALDPQPNTALLLNIALAQEGRGDVVQFLRLLDRILEIDPQNVPALTQYVNYYTRTSANTALAREYLKRAMDAHPNAEQERKLKMLSGLLPK
jgi:tetratricopeptide (TPR) repeat protein